MVHCTLLTLKIISILFVEDQRAHLTFQQKKISAASQSIILPSEQKELPEKEYTREYEPFYNMRYCKTEPEGEGRRSN